jgi:hypothetical protein
MNKIIKIIIAMLIFPLFIAIIYDWIEMLWFSKNVQKTIT